MQFCSTAGLEKLSAEFEAGRTFLVVVGADEAAATADDLITRADALDGPISPSVRKLIGPLVPVVAVDLGTSFKEFEKAVAKLVAEREAEHASAGT